MKFARQCLAALVLSVWVLAIGHVAIEHCAAMNGGCLLACEPHADHGHEGEPENDEHHHHHHFTAFASSPLAKVLDWKMPLLWRSFDRMLAAQWSEMLRLAAEPRAPMVSWESPPDARSVGCLFAICTAAPVRGPSLAA